MKRSLIYKEPPKTASRWLRLEHVLVAIGAVLDVVVVVLALEAWVW